MNDHEKHRSILKWMDSSETTEVQDLINLFYIYHSETPFHEKSFKTLN